MPRHVMLETTLMNGWYGEYGLTSCSADSQKTIHTHIRSRMYRNFFEIVVSPVKILFPLSFDFHDPDQSGYSRSASPLAMRPVLQKNFCSAVKRGVTDCRYRIMNRHSRAGSPGAAKKAAAEILQRLHHCNELHCCVSAICDLNSLRCLVRLAVCGVQVFPHRSDRQ